MFSRSPYAELNAFRDELSGTISELYEEKSQPAHTVKVSDLGWTPALGRGFGHQEVYLHQAQCYQLMKDGQHVIITTPTASGKTGAFFPAIFERLAQQPQATALFVYPLIALGQDQRDKLLQFAKAGSFDWQIGSFQGSADAPQVFLPDVRMVTATPDKLHWSLTQPSVQAFLRQLHFLVLDEAHTYRGGFGSEVAGMVRRLLNLARALGAQPQVILSTATIGNPSEFAHELTGVQTTEVSTSGAQKHGKKYFLVDHRGQPRHFWDAVVQASLSRRKKVLVFFRSRSKAARMYESYRRDLRYREHVHLYMSGTGGREARLADFRNAKKGVMFATNALEAGVDIGDLEVVILDGYPGSRMSFRQMAGRAGRIAPGLVLFIPASNADGMPHPVDVFYSNRNNFRQLMTGPLEKAVIEAANPHIMPRHEQRYQHELFTAGLGPYASSPAWWGLRGEGSPKFVVVEETDWEEEKRRMAAGEFGRYERSVLDMPLESPSLHYAHMEKHPEAIFSLDGQSYQVKRWELLRREREEVTVIVCQRIPSSECFTRGIHQTTVEPPRQSGWIQQGPLIYRYGPVRVLRQYNGYARSRQVFERVCVKCDRHPESNEYICAQCGGPIKDQMKDQKLSEHLYPVPIRLEPLPTFALEIGIDPKSTPQPEAVAHTLKHLLQKLIPEQVSCDEGNLAGAFRHDRDDFFFLYDDWKGGLGVVRRAYEHMDTLLARAYELTTQRCCEHGCYQCIEVGRCFAPYMLKRGPNPNPALERRPTDKKATAQFLQQLPHLQSLVSSALVLNAASIAPAGQGTLVEGTSAERALAERDADPSDAGRAASKAAGAGLADVAKPQHLPTPERQAPNMAPNMPPPLRWPTLARKLLDLDGLSLPEISAQLGVPSREVQHAIGQTKPLRLRHPKFGEGVFLGGKHQGQKREVLVQFQQVGQKKLLVAYANLEVIEEE